MAKHVQGYSRVQVALHWSVLVLVAFQFLAHDGIEAAWRAHTRDAAASGDERALAYLHVGVGLTVLLLVLARLYLRFTRGVPAPPPDDPPAMQLVADLTHWLIYALLFALPLSGGVAWFAGVEPAADVHEVLQQLLLLAIALHVAGALFQHFIRRSDVLMRMFRAERL